MREIKFRAWDASKKEMHLPEYTDKEDFHILADGTIVETHEHGYERYELTSRRDENWSLMQFTGLTDKNGKEIYDGDIIVIQEEDEDSVCGAYDEHTAIVYWDTQELTYRLKSVKKYALGSDPLRYMTLGFVRRYIIELLGNIHQNSELLNG